MKPRGRVLMVQGTSSHAGKTTLVAAFCRIFSRMGYRVAPFKAQNMSNNAAVTADGGEVGRAQAMQATAAGVDVTVDMNPVLLKPQSDQTSQVVVLGRARHTRNAREYYELIEELWPIVTGALDRLRAEYDIVVVEGAGSPAEINLAQYDIVNMRVALYADAPVLLVGDIERGGVFASLYGTYALLTPHERALIRGFIINKFRGDASLLDSGFEMLLERTGIPTLGVLPYLDLSSLPAEDAVDWGTSVAKSDASIDVAIMRLPRVANLDEFQPLINEPSVRIRFVADARDMGEPDLVIVPGTKSTLGDLAWMRERGLADAIVAAQARGTVVLGICGGYQMLGERILDREGAELEGSAEGLALLPVTTEFNPNKVTRRVRAAVFSACALWESVENDLLDGYEIHMGRTSVVDGASTRGPAFSIDGADDGLVSSDGSVIGTYMHGVLENSGLRRSLIEHIARRKGVAVAPHSSVTIEHALDALAASVTTNADVAAICGLVGIDAASIDRNDRRPQ